MKISDSHRLRKTQNGNFVDKDNNNEKNLITLCVRCHYKSHSKNKYIYQKLYEQIISKKYSMDGDLIAKEIPIDKE